ncbi:hypothetical protein HaLaN_04743 [Haematococcus lacustris]|uniref:Uncharacterized protein n=1 Tax=Haematococcus lacustris TaxID=44745 RepID=A0A699YJA5_HAELA|nr:hypothetical protein HaLaN_04743 [Haematococcus lacustris]
MVEQGSPLHAYQLVVSSLGSLVAVRRKPGDSQAAAKLTDFVLPTRQPISLVHYTLQVRS